MAQSKTQVLIIGAGASGLVAAISAAQSGASVTLLDSGKKPAAKLLMTGNGRCNMTNLDPHLWDQYHSSSPETLKAFTSSLQQELNVPDTLAFFKELGLLTVTKGELVYPHSEQSKSVLDALLAEAQKLHVRIKLDGKVRSIRCDFDNDNTKPAHNSTKTETGVKNTGGNSRAKKWYAATDTWEYSADRLILCAGSCAAPETGSDGSGYELARSLGHTIVKPLPALTGLICAGEKDLTSAQGARSDGTVQLYCQYSNSRRVMLKTESGQIQWTKDGISGVVIFQLSGIVSRILAEGGTAWVQIDLVPDQEEEELTAFLEKQIGLLPDLSKDSISFMKMIPALKHLLSGIVHDRLTGLIIGKAQEILPKDHKHSVVQLDPAAISRVLASTLKHLPLQITGTRSFDQSQVCAGGISLDEVDPVMLESKLAPGLFFAGEILDADGPCGGYNLQWAWSTGYTAGKYAARWSI